MADGFTPDAMEFLTQHPSQIILFVSSVESKLATTCENGSCTSSSKRGVTWGIHSFINNCVTMNFFFFHSDGWLRSGAPFSFAGLGHP